MGIKLLQIESQIQAYANKLYKRTTGVAYILATWDEIYPEDVKLYYKCYQRAFNKVMKGKL